jgi:hypothetical protein
MFCFLSGFSLIEAYSLSSDKLYAKTEAQCVTHTNELQEVLMKPMLPLRTLLVGDSPEFPGRVDKWLVKHPGVEIVRTLIRDSKLSRLGRLLGPLIRIALPAAGHYSRAGF